MTKKIKSIKLKKDYKFSLWDMSLEDLIKKNPEAFEIEYEPEKLAVCPLSKKEYYELVRLFKIAGWSWANGRPLSKYPSETCFKPCKEIIIYFKKRVDWGLRSWHSARNDYTILTVSEARQKLQEMYPDKNFSEKPNQIFFDNGACVSPFASPADYWYLDEERSVLGSRWGQPIDYIRLQSKNVFLTKEVAENDKDVMDTHNRILAEVLKIDAKNESKLGKDEFYIFDVINDRKQCIIREDFLPPQKCKTDQAKDYIMSLPDEEFKKFCLKY